MISPQQAWLCLPLWLAPATAQESPAASIREAPPERVAAEALEELAARVAAFVEEGRVVGAELHVLEGSRTVLHRAFGWRDRELGLPMEPGTTFNVRSMTKPLVGAVAQMLVDEGRLGLDDRVARHLPAFDRGIAGQVMVEHLLTHRSGLGWLVCMYGPSLEALVECSAEVGPREFVPGSSFLYSNAGSNVLGAALAAVAGEPLDALVERRLLEPLGLRDTFWLHREDDPRLARVASRYVRDAEGGWTRAWGPEDGAPLPFAQAAHGLASTTDDYARFLALWMAGGRLDEVALLSPEAVARALHPASLTQLPTRFPARRHYYGQHWSLWCRGSEGAIEAFGHAGSDGTFAWAFPGRDLRVLYFTASVDTPTGVELEEWIDRLLLAPERERVPAELEPYVGVYWSDAEAMIRSVFVDGEGRLSVDVPGTGVFQLEASDDPLRWPVAGRAGFDVGFERDASGAIVTLVSPASTGEAPAPRLLPDPSLPSVDALMELRFGGAETGSAGGLGVFRMRGRLERGGSQVGVDELWSDGELRSCERIGRSEERMEATVCNGARAATVSRRGRRRELSGAEREQTLLGRLSVLVGDWRRFYAHVQVVARTERDGREALVVRALGREVPPTTWLVDPETALAFESYGAVDSPFGAMGKVTRYEDYREVEGVRLPFRWVTSFAAEALGVTTLQYDEIETHLDAPRGLFSIDPP